MQHAYKASPKCLRQQEVCVGGVEQQTGKTLGEQVRLERTSTHSKQRPASASKQVSLCCSAPQLFTSRGQFVPASRPASSGAHLCSEQRPASRSANAAAHLRSLQRRPESASKQTSKCWSSLLL
eukprot:scaffold28809_cov21-Tisochrysis_lutea.AAC.1